MMGGMRRNRRDAGLIFYRPQGRPPGNAAQYGAEGKGSEQVCL